MFSGNAMRDWIEYYKDALIVVGCILTVFLLLAILGWVA